MEDEILWSPRHWAKMQIYRALHKWSRGDLTASETGSQIVWAVQRLEWDETGKLLPKDNLHEKALLRMDPQQGSDLADMGEWAEYVIDGFLPVRRQQ